MFPFLANVCSTVAALNDRDDDDYAVIQRVVFVQPSIVCFCKMTLLLRLLRKVQPWLLQLLLTVHPVRYAISRRGKKSALLLLVRIKLMRWITLPRIRCVGEHHITLLDTTGKVVDIEELPLPPTLKVDRWWSRYAFLCVICGCIAFNVAQLTCKARPDQGSYPNGVASERSNIFFQYVVSVDWVRLVPSPTSSRVPVVKYMIIHGSVCFVDDIRKTFTHFHITCKTCRFW